MTLENRHPSEPRTTFHQINYTSPRSRGRRLLPRPVSPREPLPYGEVYTLLDGVRGVGHYVGTSMGWGVNNNGWWGEGEVKFYLDGDGEFPTICGTGVEDYFLGSYDWEVDGAYTTYSTAYSGMHQVLKPDGLYRSQHRHSLYRWHLMDPVRFRQDCG